MLRDNTAFVYLHDQIILIGSRSGPGACVQLDFDAPVIRRPFYEMTNEDIGLAIKEAWKYCRYITLKNFKEVVGKHMEIMGVKTQKALYKNTKTVSVLLKNGIISTGSTHQNRLGGFEGIQPQIKLPETATNEEIGAAVRHALENSKTNY
jgi:hypothetical protein